MDNWILKADSDVPVVYGDSFPMRGDTADTNAIGHLKYVLNDVGDILHSYFSLGFHLSEIRRANIYEQFGYDNMKDFCINNVPVDYSVLSRCISVYERFCERTESCFYTNRINSKYEGFSFSQLVELMGLSFNSSHLPRLKNYSVAKLRDLRKFCVSRYGKYGYNSDFLDQYEESLNVVDNCDVATGEPESGNCDAATEKDKKAELNAIVLNKLSTLKGAALYSFVRGFPTSHKLDVTFYDSAGKKVYGGSISCDVIYSDDDTLHVRVSDDELSVLRT